MKKPKADSKTTILRKNREALFNNFNKDTTTMELTQTEVTEALNELENQVNEALEERVVEEPELKAADFEDRRTTKDRRAKKPRKATTNKRAYGFEESLAIIKLLNENRSLDDISGLVKRSPYSLNYKFFDKKRGYKGSRSFNDICKAFDKNIVDVESNRLTCDKLAEEYLEKITSQVTIQGLSN